MKHIAIGRFSDQMGTVTSESTSMAAHCSFKETAVVDLGALLDAGEGALVTLVAQDTCLIAHRAVLAARSPVFTAMLCHGTQNGSCGQVVMREVEGPVLRQLLAYLYTLQAPLVSGMAPQLLAAADKFGLSALKAVCEVQVAAQLSVENAAATAVLAIKHSSTSLRQAAITFIRAHFLQVMATQGWGDAMCYNTEHVIEVYRLLTVPPVESSPRGASLCGAPAAADSRPTTKTRRQLHTGRSRSRATAAATTLPKHRGDAVSRLRGLSIKKRRQRLIQAAKDGTVDDVKVLLAAGADAGARDRERMTALHHVAQRGHVESARCLLDGGADVDARNPKKITALHMGAYYGHAAVVRLLLAAGARVGASSDGRWTALHWAAQEGHLEVVQSLLAAGAEVDVRGSKGQVTPLYLAAQRGHAAVVSSLLRAGAEVDARDVFQATPLHRAASFSHLAVVQVLLASSADPNARQQEEWTPLHFAARYGHAAVAWLLTVSSADPNATEKTGWTPLHLAARYGRAAVVQMLAVSSGDINAGDKTGWTPLHLAAYYGHAKVAAVLLKAGADREARINEGQTPLDIAREQKKQQLVDMLTSGFQ